MSHDPTAASIQRWSGASSAERANYALFLAELCDVLGVPRPEPATDDSANNAYGWPWRDMAVECAGCVETRPNHKPE